jgi:uncharacterized protein (UPF0276 family)
MPYRWAGIGLRRPHYGALLTELPALGFVEVHSENFFAPGGAAKAVLRDVREHYDVSLHGVGLGLGSAAGLDQQHLRQLAQLVAEVGPVRVSDHACFCRADLPGQALSVHGADLLPIAFTDASMALMARHVHQVQEALRRPLLVENLSAYLRCADDVWPETEFLVALCRRTGCRLLLDVNNLVVNALNWSVDGMTAASRGAAASEVACAWIDQIPVDLVGQIHLAGHRPPDDPSALVIDDHSQAVNPSVWATYRHALEHFGATPTLIEWDVDLPPFQVLLDQAHQAAQCLNELALPEHTK